MARDVGKAIVNFIYRSQLSASQDHGTLMTIDRDVTIIRWILDLWFVTQNAKSTGYNDSYWAWAIKIQPQGSNIHDEFVCVSNPAAGAIATTTTGQRDAFWTIIQGLITLPWTGSDGLRHIGQYDVKTARMLDDDDIISFYVDPNFTPDSGEDLFFGTLTLFWKEV